MTWTPQDEKDFKRLRGKLQRSYEEEVELRMKMEKLSNIANIKGKSRYDLTEAGRMARMHRNVYNEDFSFAGWRFLSSEEPFDGDCYLFRGRQIDMLQKRVLPEDFDLKFSLLLPDECMRFKIQFLAEDSIVHNTVFSQKKSLPEKNPSFFEFSILADGRFSSLRMKNPLNNNELQALPKLQKSCIGENFFQIVKTENQVRIFVNECELYEIFQFPWNKVYLRFVSSPESSGGCVDLTALQIYDVAQTTGRGRFRLPLSKPEYSIPIRPNQKKRP